MSDFWLGVGLGAGASTLVYGTMFVLFLIWAGRQ